MAERPRLMFVKRKSHAGRSHAARIYTFPDKPSFMLSECGLLRGPVERFREVKGISCLLCAKRAKEARRG